MCCASGFGNRPYNRSMIIHLDTLDDPRLDAYARLTDVQLRCKLEPELGLFIAESPKVIERALEAAVQPVSLLTSVRLQERIAPFLVHAFQAKAPDAPIFVLPDEELEQLTGFKLAHGALAAFRRPPQPPLEKLLADARRIAILEDITNFTNVGAIFRSAAALGMDAVLVTPGCYDPLYRRAVRVSMGAVLQIPWGYIGQDGPAEPGAHGNVAHKGGWSHTGIPLLHEAGFRVASMALSQDSITLDDPALKAESRLAIILGTEGEGLAPATLRSSDYIVRIPMQRGVDSLNVAAASAVAFWELVV